MPAVKSYKRTTLKRQKIQRASLKASSVRRLTSFVFLMSLLVLALLSYFHASSLMSQVWKGFETSTAYLGLRLEDVIVEGRIRTDKSQILNNLGFHRGTPLLAINLSDAKTKLEEISWVNAVCIERRFPDTLFIRISEKEPVAIWQSQEKTYLVDRDGELVETKEAHKYKELLLVAGDQAPRYVGNLMVLLEKFPEIKFRVTAATHLRSTRWDIRLDGKIDVKLPEKAAERALGYLHDLEKHHHLMEQEEILTIDLRLPDQLILRLTPEAAQRKNNTGQDA
ncbi:MAG TPA: FtsQ-type POTRA domain-containing protein [Alphaproteobacteria bacterium]|nr:FtsQ-type POTRA domain-containing protein [Alphaproteobacteria bacterium]